MLLRHRVRLAASRTFCTAGNSNEINTPMMASSTRSSIRLNPSRRALRIIGTSHVKKGPKESIPFSQANEAQLTNSTRENEKSDVSLQLSLGNFKYFSWDFSR